MEIEISKLPHDKPSNRSSMFKNIPMFTHARLISNSFHIVSSLLKGTESNEWLVLGENSAYKIIKNGGNDRVR